MSEPYELFVLVPKGVEAARAVRSVDRALARVGGGLDDHSELLLEEHDGEEPDWVPVSDADAALDRLISWPTLGTLVYGMPDAAVTASFKGADGLVKAVVIATPHMTGELPPEALERYQRIGGELHNELDADRTIMDWGLSSRGHRWRAELARAAAGEESGPFEILDLGPPS